MSLNTAITFLFFISCTGICSSRKNVLILMVDDLRPQLNVYNRSDYYPTSVSPPMITPNIDALADKSLLLHRAYVQAPMCGPSRASLLTGRRPDTTHVYDLKEKFRDVGGNFTTLPQYFKENGYKSIGLGKIFHPGTAADDLFSFDEYFEGTTNHEHSNYSWNAIEDTKLNKRSLKDRQIADEAITKLRVLAAGTDNFFLAVGFHKPHEPFVFPDTYLTYYPETGISLPSNNQAPLNMPEVAWSTYNGTRSYGDIAATGATGEIGTTLPDAKVLELRRAYYSTVTWIDSLVGEILDELENLTLSDNTVVSFISDHGFSLGEHGEWGKRTNFELSLHAPMMIHIPGLTDTGIDSDELVEYVDIFPTIVEAAGLGNISLCPDDSTDVDVCHEGTSLIPLITKPNTALKNASFSQTESPYPGDGRIMGYSMRTNQYRYTEWVTFRYAPYYTPNWNKNLSGIELYDHFADSDENFNLAYETNYTTMVAELSTQLRSGWRSAIISSP